MKSLTQRYWQVPPPYRQNEDDKKLALAFGIEPEIIHILKNRGIRSQEDIKKYLFPTLKDLEPPFLLRGMQEACEILHRALVDQEQILIWGDYDVDGVTATALLTIFLQKLGTGVRWFIPNRFTHGYGLHYGHLGTIIGECASPSPVLITVDCGISNQEEIAFAQSLGCKVIVVDHHEPGEGSLNADAVLNPKQQGCLFRDKNLAGVGLAFYLAIGLRSYLAQKKFLSGEKPNLKALSELVALGTVADMVPLTGCNRILVKAGFEVINHAPSPGVAALLRECDIRSANINAEDIAFQLAPKINAAGRLEKADLAVSLLLEQDPAAAKKIARKLSLLNEKRKDLCKECLESTLMRIDNLSDVRDCLILKVEYSLGILGIVASQLVEKIRKPVILVTEAEDTIAGVVLKGSCRSVPGVNIFAALENCREHLLKFGGHPMAAGITLLEDELEIFSARLSEEMKRTATFQAKGVRVDLELQLEKALAQKNIRQMQLLEPFGVDNEKPVFLDKQVIVQDIYKVGQNGDHLSFRKRGQFESPKCIAFQFGKYEEVLKQYPTFDLVYTISLSRYRNAETWQAQLVDFLCSVQ